MRNSLRILHVIQFRCLVKLFFFFIVIIIFVATFMVNKDEYIYKSQLTGWRYLRGNALAIHRSRFRVLVAWAPLCIGLGQATYICVPLSPIIWYRQRGGVIPLAEKVTAGLVESNSSLYTTGFMTKSPVGWLPRNRDQLRVQRS